MYLVKKRIILAIWLIAGCFAPDIGLSQPIPEALFKQWAEKPPMGWNSYDAYHGAITEVQFKKSVDILSQKMLPFGYEYAVIDFCWFHPGPEGWDPDTNWKPFKLKQHQNNQGKLFPTLIMDSYGRLLPAANRFPSAMEGKGFTEISQYVHGKGMKFGIHIMRGIPRQAVEKNTPIFGTRYRAKDIAETFDTCKWLNHMYGVDASKPGAQEYYNSLFNLYASWGVDFVKVDDISAPTYHKSEIELIRKAIDQCGRSMVLSLSCGETFISYGKHADAFTNMYRISIDFWDEWSDVAHMFDLLYAWQPFIGDGSWPDADMIPIGKLCLSNYPSEDANGQIPKGKREHDSFLTPDEQKTLMTLWCMARSPLIWGGDPERSDSAAYTLLTNKEALEINQHSTNNRASANFVYSGMKGDIRVWIADQQEGKGHYLAFFNLSDSPKEVSYFLEWEEIRGRFALRDVWARIDLGETGKEIKAAIPPHGTVLYKLTKL